MPAFQAAKQIFVIPRQDVVLQIRKIFLAANPAVVVRGNHLAKVQIKLVAVGEFRQFAQQAVFAEVLKVAEVAFVHRSLPQTIRAAFYAER